MRVRLWKWIVDEVCVRSFQDDKMRVRLWKWIVEVYCVRSFQDDKNEGKIVEVDCG